VRLINRLEFRVAHILLLTLVLATGAYAGWAGDWVEAGVLIALGGFGGWYVKAQDQLPELFVLLVVMAGVLNAAGYVLGLWNETTPFDEFVHLFTSFAGCAAVGWLILVRTQMVQAGQRGKLVLVVLAIGIVLGLLWEVFEWAIGIIGGVEDTMIDLLMDSLGAVAAALFCAFIARRQENRSK
jgi:hypothetical protein